MLNLSLVEHFFVGTDFSLYSRAELGLVASRRVLIATENAYANSETTLTSPALLPGFRK